MVELSQKKGWWQCMQIEPSRHHILLVGPLVHRMAPHVESCGYQVAARAKGSDALLLMKAKAFHVLLFELNLDDIEIRTFIKEAKEIQPDCAYLLLDDPAKTGMIVSALVHGVDAYISTPPDEQVLYGQIARHALAALARGGGEMPMDDLISSQKKMNAELMSAQLALQELSSRHESLEKDYSKMQSELVSAQQELEQEKRTSTPSELDDGSGREYIHALKEQVKDLKHERTSLIDKLSLHGVDVSDEHGDLIEMIDDDDDAVFGEVAPAEGEGDVGAKQTTGADVIYLGSGYETSDAEELVEIDEDELLDGSDEDPGSALLKESDAGPNSLVDEGAVVSTEQSLSQENERSHLDDDLDGAIASKAESSEKDVEQGPNDQEVLKGTQSQSDSKNASPSDAEPEAPPQKPKAARKSVPSAIDFFDDDLDFLATRQESKEASVKEAQEGPDDINDDAQGFLDELTTSTAGQAFSLGELAKNKNDSKEDFQVRSQLAKAPINDEEERDADGAHASSAMTNKRQDEESWEPSTLETGSLAMLHETDNEKRTDLERPHTGAAEHSLTAGENENLKTINTLPAGMPAAAIQSALEKKTKDETQGPNGPANSDFQETPATGLPSFAIKSALGNDDHDDATRVSPMLASSDFQETPATGLPSFAIKSALGGDDNDDATRVSPMMASSDFQETPATGLPSFAIKSALGDDDNDDATRVSPMMNSQPSSVHDPEPLEPFVLNKEENETIGLGNLGGEDSEHDFDDSTSVAPMFTMPQPATPARPLGQSKEHSHSAMGLNRDRPEKREFDLDNDDDFGDATMVNVAMSEIEAIPEDLDLDIDDSLAGLFDADEN